MAAMDTIRKRLGDEAEDLLTHKARGIPKEQLHLPGPDFVDRVVAQSDRPAGRSLPRHPCRGSEGPVEREADWDEHPCEAPS